MGGHKGHVQKSQSYYDKDIFIYVYIQYFHILKSIISIIQGEFHSSSCYTTIGIPTWVRQAKRGKVMRKQGKKKRCEDEVDFIKQVLLVCSVQQDFGSGDK